MQAAGTGANDLLSNDSDVKILANILKTLVASCMGCAGGSPPPSFITRAGEATSNGVGGLTSSTPFNGSSSFYPQVGKMFMDLLGLYRAASELISAAVAENPKLLDC